jgi:hypothetical protein
MPKPTLEFHAPAGPWTPAPATVPGIWQQVLAADPATGLTTTLSRWEPGTDSTPTGPAVHAYWEEVYLLAGDLTDLTLGQTWTAGVYACRPPGMVHGPWRSAAGALLLEVRYPPAPEA